MTALELLTHLNADPEFVRRQKERADELARRESEGAAAEKPIVDDLRAAGLVVGSVWDLVNRKAPLELHKRVLLILLKHLNCVYPDGIRDGIARAMAIPAAKFALPTLTKLYREERGQRAKSGLAVAISNATDDDTIFKLFPIINDRANGTSRLLLLDALQRSRLPQSRRALEALATDPDLQQEVQAILRKKIRPRRRSA